MTDREKIIEIIDKWASRAVIAKINGASVYDQNNAAELAHALIAANIGDVTEWKEKVECAKRILQFPTLPNGTTDLSYFEYKGERIQDIARERDEYKHRAEAAEERLKKLKKTEGDLTVEEEINILENLVEEAKHRSFVFEGELVKYKIAFDKAIKLAYKIRTDFDVLSCSSCEFGYAIDVCKKTGLYSDCENRWKEELLQQASREIAGENDDDR